jgi:hypothetical protein
MTLLERSLAPISLWAEANPLEMTFDQFADEIVRVIANADRADFAHGPYVYSISVIERGQGGSPADPSAVYHYELYGKDADAVRAAIAPLAKVGAKLDVSVRQSSAHAAEHKVVHITVHRS